MSGLTGNVGLILLIFGIAALIGIWITGMLVDRHLRNLVLLSLAALAAISVALVGGMREQLVVFLAVIVWGWSFGGASTQMQTAAADAAGDHVDVIQAMVTTAWNQAIASGGVMGVCFSIMPVRCLSMGATDLYGGCVDHRMVREKACFQARCQRTLSDIVTSRDVRNGRPVLAPSACSG